jgi:hypothetical protein
MVPAGSGTWDRSPSERPLSQRIVALPDVVSEFAIAHYVLCQAKEIGQAVAEVAGLFGNWQSRPKLVTSSATAIVGQSTRPVRLATDSEAARDRTDRPSLYDSVSSVAEQVLALLRRSIWVNGKISIGACSRP